MAQPTMSQSYQVQEESCACMAAHMQKWEEKQQAHQQEQKKSLFVKKDMQLDKNTLYSEIYGPCLYITAQEIVYQQCYYDKTNQNFAPTIQHLDGMCRCRSDAAVAFLQPYGGPLVAALLTQNPNATDPLEMVLNSGDYNSAIGEQHMACFNKYTQKNP